jgi:hypothetical protein
MSTGIKVYKIKDFVRFNESGEIDFDRSMQMIRDFALTTSFYTGHNILADLRETTLVGETNIGMILQLALEMARYGSSFKGKIANVVPNEERRLSIAKTFETSMQFQGFNLKIFTSFEDAIDWLSEITDMRDPSQIR